MSDNVHNTLS